jgi:GH24 family phage-related lysozyme (muramidase)
MGCTKQYQLDALTSLAYNCGKGVVTGTNSLMNAISDNPLDEDTIRPIWENFYITSGGQQLQGLIARRIEECNMFFNKTFEVRAIPIIGQSGNITGTVTDNEGNGWLP